MEKEKRFEVVGVNLILGGFVAIEIRTLDKLPVIEEIPKTELEKEVAVAQKMMVKMMPKLLPFDIKDALKGRIIIPLLYYKAIGSPTVRDVLVISIKKEEEPR